MADTRAKSLGYLRDGKVTIGAARRPRAAQRPDFVSARVVGHHAAYLVRFVDGEWTCTCTREAGQDCAHLAAVQLVTGHPSAAAREAVAS